MTENGNLAAQEATAQAFFTDCPEDGRLAKAKQLLATFLAHTANAGADRTALCRPLVVVTSGGTTVPLERRCVRFIDNFSAGTRGALSAEQFLQAGYAVVLLRRTGSVEPFTSHLPAPSLLPCLTQCMEVDSQQCLSIRPQHAEALQQCVGAAQRAQQTHSLLQIEFETIFEYMQLLRAIAQGVGDLGPRVLFYLAAAVSDFYVPWEELAEHKIQSGDGDLQLALTKVPKVLGLLVRRWAPRAVVISFKLETDELILIKKACTALNNYGVHAVVANLLHTRKDRVLLVQPRTTYEAVLHHTAAAWQGVAATTAAAAAGQGVASTASTAAADGAGQGTTTAHGVGQGPQGSAAGWHTPGQGGGTPHQPPVSLHAADGTPLPLPAVESAHASSAGVGGTPLPLPALGPYDASTAGAGGAQGPGLNLCDAAVVVTSIVRPQTEPVIETLLVGDVVRLHAALILTASDDGNK